MYRLQKQDIVTVVSGKGNIYEHQDVLAMDLIPYAYPDGNKRIRTHRSLTGISYDTAGMVPCTNETMLTIYFTKEHEIHSELSDGQLVIVRWVSVLGGYRAKGVTGVL